MSRRNRIAIAAGAIVVLAVVGIVVAPLSSCGGPSAAVALRGHRLERKARAEYDFAVQVGSDHPEEIDPDTGATLAGDVNIASGHLVAAQAEDARCIPQAHTRLEIAALVALLGAAAIAAMWFGLGGSTEQ